jgi:hypothetical protein
MKLNTPTSRQEDNIETDSLKISLIPTEPLPQTPFTTNKVLSKTDTSPQYIPPQADSLLVKKMS